MVQQNSEKDGVIEVRLNGVSIPRAGELANLLQEWVSWTKKYGALLENVGGLNDLHERSIDAVRKWGRDG